MFNNIILYRFDQYMILGTSTCKPTHVCKYANKLVKQKSGRGEMLMKESGEM